MTFLRDVISRALQDSQIETRSFGTFDETVANVEAAVKKALLDEPMFMRFHLPLDERPAPKFEQRRYSVAEIDVMRRAVSARMKATLGYGNQSPTLVEERLRTYMLNGTDPGELVVAAEACRAETYRAELRERHRRRMGMQP